jgi:hypothetical protein
MALFFNLIPKMEGVRPGISWECVREICTKVDYLGKHRILSPFTFEYVQFRCV